MNLTCSQAKNGFAKAAASLLVFILLTAFCGLAHAERVFEKYQTAVLRGLDKPKARVLKFEVQVGRPVFFGPLKVLVRDCRKTTPEDEPEVATFIEVTDPREKKEQASILYRGWMFASSPALTALEHPIYDVWVLDCKNPIAAPPSSEPPAAKEAVPEDKAKAKKRR